MPRPRLLISDMTGGEVSPRVQARADLERYGRAMKRCENFVIAQQGGILLRRGSEYVGDSSANLLDPVPAVAFFTWRGSYSGEPDILFELSGVTLRGWTHDGPVMSGSVPYSVVLPVPSFAATPVQSAQSGKTIALVNGVDAPLLLTVNATDDWSLDAIPSTLFPSRSFGDAVAPPAQDAVNDVTFVGFAAGNTYYVYVDGKVIKERVLSSRTRFSELVPQKFVYSSASTATNESRIKEAILLSPSAPDPAGVTVAFQAGTTYRITMSGESGGIEVSLVAAAESAAVRIEQATNAGGRTGDELAWSYPTVVLHLGFYYQCLQAHISSGATQPGGAPLHWRVLTGPPYYESIQPSATWLIGSVSYAPGNRGFPSSCSFHEQRLVVAGSRHAPKAIWGSAIGWFVNFVLGAEPDEAWSVDLDAKDSPNIRWLLSYNGLVVGTSAGIWILTAETTLSPTDFQATRYSGDRVEALQAELAGNEMFYIAQGRRQLRSLRYNEQQGPYETLEASVLAEHLARYGLEQIVYAHHPQPAIHVRTAHPGLVIGVAYNRQGDLLAFYRLQLNAEILNIGVMFDADDGDVLWLVVKRGSHVTIERIPYPITDAPVDVPDTTATVHLDGWVERTSSSGTIAGLAHLIGRTVTVLDAAGAVAGSATVADSGSAPPTTPVAISEGSFEAAGTWTYTGPTVRQAPPARTGLWGVKMTPANGALADLISAPISVTPGNIYRFECWYQNKNNLPGHLFGPLQVWVYDSVSAVIYAASSGVNIGTLDTWLMAEVTFQAPANADHIRINASVYQPGTTALEVWLDDYAMFEGVPGDGVITFTGTDVIVGEPFFSQAITVEPVAGNPAGPSMGNPKRWSNINARLHQSALPKLNGERPSDYEQAGGAYRANPGTLRSGDYKVNTDGWADGSITIEQDLPHATQVVGLFGDLGVGTGG